ncbi:MAG: hypothetical protein FWF15_02005 [Oscillospiraceae bacterium]|nr:hypothetical protein [Oscillospiraceae bacterium]
MKPCSTGETTGCGCAAHGSSRGSVPTRATLPRFAPPRVSAPVLSGEYHYHQSAVYLPGHSEQQSAAKGRSCPLQAVPARGSLVIVPGVPL